MSRYELDHIRTQGSQEVLFYPLYPGIELYRNQFRAEQAVMLHPPDAGILEIHYCHAGRAGWNMQGGSSLYLGAGDVSLHAMAYCADSELMFPLGYYEGLFLAMDLRKIAEHPPEILKEAGVDFEKFSEKYCSTQKSAVFQDHFRIRSVFEALYQAMPAGYLPYLKLKVQELMLLFSQEDPKIPQKTEYGQGQVQVIRQIHRQLTEDLRKRYTIEELSKQYLMNTSTLKELFKEVYGMPLASYMKEYRVHCAMELLKDTSESIAFIAGAVGYETQGKFAKAFKDVTRVLPSEYRKQQKRT